MFQFGKKSVVWKWIISYISIIVLSVTCNIFIYQQSQKYITAKQQQISELVLQQTENNLKQNALEMEHLREEVLVNQYFTSLNKTTNSFHDFLLYRKYSLFNDLNIYKSINNSYAHLILYFETCDEVISQVTINSPERFWEIYEADLGVGRERWLEMLHGDYTGVTALNADNLVIYARTIQGESEEKQKVNLFVIYNYSNLQSLLGNYQYNEETTLMIYGQNNSDPLVFDNPGLIQNDEDKELVRNAITSGVENVELTSGERVTVRIGSNGVLGTTCLLTPEGIYLEAANQFQFIFLIASLISMFMFLVLTVLFIKSNYKPVQALLNTLETDNSEPYKDNEYAVVKEKISQVKSEYQNANLVLKKQNRLLQNVYLTRLLMGEKALAREDMYERYNIEFQYNRFAVMLLYVDDLLMGTYDEDDTYDSDTGSNEAGHEEPVTRTAAEELEDLEDAQFVLVNVFSEIITNKQCIVYQTRIDNTLVLLLNVPDDIMLHQIASSIINEGTEFISSYYNMEYTTAISNEHSDISQIAVAYQEALQALEAKQIYGLDNIVYYSDITEMTSSNYYYPYDVEQDLLRNLQMSRQDRVMEIFEEIKHENVATRKIASTDIIRCLMFDVLGTVLKALDNEADGEAFIRELRPAKRLASSHDAAEAASEMREILQRVCEYFKNKQSESSDNGLCHKIEEYINENYKDVNLCVASIANKFSISSVSMSRMFRDNTGTKIPNMIAEIRIREAKRLMLSTAFGLAEIAEMVGFGSTKTFTRVFKQMDESTPGQWRDERLRQGTK